MKNNKTKIFFLAAAIITLIGFYSYNAAYSFEKDTPSAGNSVTDSTVTKTYTCPMHPEVISDKPGKCPKCRMGLEQKDDESRKDEKKDEGNNDKGHHGCMGH